MFVFSPYFCVLMPILVREKIVDDLKLLHPFLDFPLADPQTDSCRKSFATLKFDVCSFFFSDQNLVLLNWN
jgi:hypothetical protein